MKQIIENIWHVGDSGCAVYLVDTRSDAGLVLIDAGMDLEMIRDIAVNGLGFEDIRHCILTHCHIDHTAVCAGLSRDLPGLRFYAHALDAPPIEESGHDGRTAAGWYGITYEPVSLYRQFDADTVLTLGRMDFQCLHIPGHTPGSIAVMVESAGKKVLFGQDLHGPFSDDFFSDLADYKKSMDRLLALDADILCEGHFGIFQPKERMREFIKEHRERNLR
ncbi:MAG: MBL fold metallo-hydrolase [Desulfotignum sp.]|nr:MBL fold metallo-hydrolase [Desulfotignum sp.]